MEQNKQVRRYFTKEDIEQSDMREEFKADALKYLHHKIKDEEGAVIIGIEDYYQDYYYIVAYIHESWGDIVFKLMNDAEFVKEIEE